MSQGSLEFLDLLILRVQLLTLFRDLSPAGGKVAIMLFQRRVPGPRTQPLRGRLVRVALRFFRGFVGMPSGSRPTDRDRTRSGAGIVRS